MHGCVVMYFIYFFFFKQKTAYEMRISDWSSDVCSSDLLALLIIAQLGALPVNRRISTRLVEQRIIPMGQLQTINSAYQTSWAIADKVQTGTIDKAGGVTALHDIRTALGEDWRELESGTPDMAAQFAENRIDADRAVERLETLLR